MVFFKLSLNFVSMFKGKSNPIPPNDQIVELIRKDHNMYNDFSEQLQRLRGAEEFDGEDNDAAARRAIAIDQL